MRRSFLLTEVILTVGLTVLLAAVFAAAVVQYAQVRREQDTRRMLRLAAAAELECVRAGLIQPQLGTPTAGEGKAPALSRAGEGEAPALSRAGEGEGPALFRAGEGEAEPHDAEPPAVAHGRYWNALPPGVRVHTSAVPGQGPWHGLWLVRAVAERTMAGGRLVSVELSAYVADAEVPR